MFGWSNIIYEYMNFIKKLMERGFIGRSEKKGLADGEVYNGSGVTRKARSRRTSNNDRIHWILIIN